MNKRRSPWQNIPNKIALAIAFLVLTIITSNFSVRSQSASSTKSSDLPVAKIHSLPPTLANWQDKTNSGDYYGQIEPTPLGYLVWSQFPITIFVEKPLSLNNIDTSSSVGISNTANSAADKRFQQWRSVVEKEIANWSVYLPLKEIADQEKADIVVWRSQPQRKKAKLNPDTKLYDIPRAVTAETNYKFYLKQNPSAIAHQMTVEISPTYGGISLEATIRHELGHALGIWGHSLAKNDALYFSQVGNPPKISPRDINTLKKIYQQPTKLGWEIIQ